MFNLLQRQTLRTKLILAFLLTVLLPLLGTSLYGNWITSRILQTQAINTAVTDLRLRKQQIESHLNGVREDLLFLSHLDSLRAAVEAPTAASLANLQTDFAEFISTHPNVFQARYLDSNGREIVRVEASDGTARIVPENRLQNKADRYYFQATMALNEGEVYVSPVDLNREFGQIQEPRTPTIRYATPLLAADGRKAGIIILNLYAEPFLNFARAGELEDAALLLTDENGYYLSHPDPAAEWGGPADLDTGLSAAQDYAAIWPEISQSESGIVNPPPANLWQFLVESFMPFDLLPAQAETPRHILVYDTVQEGGNRWLLLYDVPLASLFASVSTFRLTAGSIIIAAILIAVGMAVILSRQLTAPIQALTIQARRFGQEKGRRSRRPSPSHAPPSRNEIEELTLAFREMSGALEHHMEQLAQLNLAGHHIAARLERAEVLTAVATAIFRLFPAEYLVITLPDGTIFPDGDPAWEQHRDQDTTQSILRAALNKANWHITALDAASGPAGYLCCASLHVGEGLGLVEMYGRDPELGDAATGDTLATLAVQASIALENAGLYEKLARRRAELQKLLEQLIDAQEEERRVIAYDIHDGLIQMLVGARLHLRNFAADRETRPERAGEALNKGISELGAAIVEARRVIEGLRPATLDDLGLAATIGQLAEETQAESGWELAYETNLGSGRLPAAVETTAFRILQEAITNARKYAQTNRLRLRLWQSNGKLEIEVQDYGRGFNPAAADQSKHGGVGLRSMQERARLLGGECVVESAPGKGTKVTAVIPLP